MRKKTADPRPPRSLALLSRGATGLALLLTGIALSACPPPQARRETPPPAAPTPTPAPSEPAWAYELPDFDPEIGGLFQLVGVVAEQEGELSRLVCLFNTARGPAMPRFEVLERAGGFDFQLFDTRAPRFPHSRVIELSDDPHIERVTFHYPDDAMTVVRVETRRHPALSFEVLDGPPRLVASITGPRR